MHGDTFLRHGLRARILHAVDAVAVLILIVTGLALGDVIPGRIATIVGGHLAINATHRLLGIALVVALLLVVIALPRRVARLLRDVCHLHRSDWHWPFRFIAFLVTPRRHAAPYHDGHFDPTQRIVFLGILVTLAAAGASGAYLYFWTPAFPLGQLSMAYAIRIHIVAAWLLIACLALHILAGSGILWTHRGITAAMFGHGRIPTRVAHNLWPACTPGRTSGSGSLPDHRDNVE